jgi:hypothetical protein
MQHVGKYNHEIAEIAGNVFLQRQRHPDGYNGDVNGQVAVKGNCNEDRYSDECN